MLSYLSNLLFMKKIFFLLLSLSGLVGTTFAYEVVCPSWSGCDQCFRFTLADSNSNYDVFVPRVGKNEKIDLDASSIFAETYQWASVTPTGNIKSSFTLNGGPSTSQWTWANMNGYLIQKWTIPSSINYSNPVYRIKYVTQSYTLDTNNQKESGSDRTHTECAYFYATQPQSQNNPTPVDGQCSNLDTYATSNPRNSSLSWEDLCDEGNPSSVTYSSARERWTYTCYGSNGGDNDSCVVDLEQEEDIENDSCRIEVADRSGVVPFSTSILCSWSPSGKTAIVISKNGRILDAIESDSESYDFDDSGVFTISCYPDIVSDRSNVCKKTVSVSGDCGNDSQESDEQCDDGNTISGDGCNRYCQIENANTMCGNAVLETGEQCDDGNTNNGDSCTNLCQNQTPTTGPVTYVLLLTVLLSLMWAGYYVYKKRHSVA